MVQFPLTPFLDISVDQYKAEVDLALKAPDAANLEKTLLSILDAVDKLPGKGTSASKAVGEIVGQIKAIQTALKSTGSLNAVIGDVKGLAASLKSLNNLSKSLDLFSNQDVARINSGANAIRQAAKAYEEVQRASQVQKGVFGLDETKIAGVNRAAKSLQGELNAIKQSLAVISGDGKPRVNPNDPLVQKAIQIQRNLKALETYRVQLQQTDDLEKYNAAMRKQDDALKLQFFKEREKAEKAQTKNLQDQLKAEEKQKSLRDAQNDGRVLSSNLKTGFSRSDLGRQALVGKTTFDLQGTARFADPNFVSLQAAQRELADLQRSNKLRLEGLNLKGQDARLSEASRNLQQQITQKVKENTLELAKGNGENERTRRLSKEILDLQAQLKIQKSQEAQQNPILKQASEQNRIDSMLSRTTGVGGAALLKVQAALIANYSVLTGAISAVRSAITTSVQLEAAFRNIQAVTATTGTEMKGLEEKIKGVASQSKFSAIEVAEAALILGQAGLSAKQVADALPSVVMLATAAGTSIANAVDLVTSVVGVFDKQASDTADVANKITSASNTSKVSVEKLALAFQYVGNAAAQTGVSFEETTAALAAMSNAGIKSGSTLGTGLRQFLTEVQKPSEEFLTTLRRVGLSISDIDVRANGLVGVISNLRAAGFVASDAIRSFDVRGAAAFNALVANPEALQQQYLSLQNTRAAVEANEIQMQSFEAQSKRLTTALSTTVATGLGPLQTALTSVASGLANALNWVGQYQGALQALVTTTTVFIGLGIVRHLAGIAAGYLTLSGASVGAIATLRGLTTATIGQAAASISLATASGVTSTSLVAMGLSAARTGVLVYSLSGAIGVVTGALRALWAAVAGLSVLSGVGLVLGAVAIATLAFESASDKAKRKLDELKASSNNAKAAFDEKRASVDSLSKKIDELAYKQTYLEGNQKGLDQTTRDLNAQFGSLGVQIDLNNNSFSTMISKLKQVRTEMQVLADAKLSAQLQSDEKLLSEQVSNLQSSLGTRAARVGARGLSNFVSTEKVLEGKGVSEAQRAAATKGLSTLVEVTSPNLTGPQQSLEALLRAASALEIIRNSLTNDKQRERFKELATPLQEAVSKAIDVANQKAVVSGIRAQQSSRASNVAFEAMPAFGGRTYSEALPSFYDVQGRVNMENKKAGMSPNEVQAYFQIKERIDSEIAKTETIRRTLEDLKGTGLDTDLAEKRIQEANQRAEQFRAAGKALYATIQQRIKLQTDSEVAELNAKAANRNLPLAERKKFKLAAGDAEAAALLAGSFGADERAEALAAAKQRVRSAQAEGLRSADGASVERDKYKALASSLISEAEVFEAKAKGQTLNAKNAMTIEELDTALDEAVRLMGEAKAKRLAALTQNQNAQVLPKDQDEKVKAANAVALAAESETADEKIANFVQGATAIYKAVGKRVNKLGAKADATLKAQELDRLRSNAEEALFEAGQPLAAIRQKVAAGDLPSGTTQEKQAKLDVAKAKLTALGDELTFFARYVDDLKKAAEEARKNTLAAKAELDSASPETRARSLVKYEQMTVEQKEAEDRLRAATKERNQTRGQFQDQQSEVTSGQRAIPQEASWGNIKARIDQTLQSYSETVKSFDQVGAIGAGIQSTLEGLSGGFSSLFTNIATGAMSAKDAFKSFAVSIIRSMLDIIAQALAMAAIKAILEAMGFSTGGVVPSSAPTSAINTSAATPVRAASGGHLSGGTPGKDSIPLMAMPGEYVLQKSAVDAVGVDFMHSLNNQTSNSVAKSGATAFGNSREEPSVTNIWLVTPDQKPSIGPKDVVIAVQDNLSQSASPLKMLVKQIATGQV